MISLYRSAKLVKKMQRLVYNSTFTYPLVIKNGDGCIIEDIDGNKFIDFTSNIGSCPLGYSHPEILNILKSYASCGAHKIAGQDFYSEEHMFLAEELLSIFPREFKTFFVNSGSEAVENGIKLAYRQMGPLPGISFINAFHGRTLGALTCTLSKDVQKYNFPEFSVKRFEFCTNDLYYNLDALEKTARNSKVSFIISEIIQGEGGCYVASKNFIKKLSSLSKELGIPLIIDEVQTGMGRTGKWWAYQHYNIIPDIVSVAKALQIGAIVFKKKFEPREKGVLSSTWGGGSRIDMVVGKKIIEVIKKENLLSNVSIMGEKILKRLREFVDKYGIIEARGIGLMIGLEFNKKENRDKAMLNMFKSGLLVLPAGNKTIRITPPLIIDESTIDNGINILENGLKKSSNS